VSAEPASE
jgi:hypothetical protein